MCWRLIFANTKQNNSNFAPSCSYRSCFGSSTHCVMKDTLLNHTTKKDLYVPYKNTFSKNISDISTQLSVDLQFHAPIQLFTFRFPGEARKRSDKGINLAAPRSSSAIVFISRSHPSSRTSYLHAGNYAAVGAKQNVINTAYTRHNVNIILFPCC